MLHYVMMRPLFRYIILGILLLIFIGAIFWGTSVIEEQEMAQGIISHFGVFGIFFLAFLSGFNILVPLHVAALTPLFLSAGFSMPVIITTYVAGTITADLVGYTLGLLGKTTAERRYPLIHAKVTHFVEHRKKWIVPGLFLYAAFAPTPNEAVLIPLGLVGFEFKKFIIPLILGSILNHTIFGLGFVHVFELLF
jgi:membrane protein YqaA with SNARE-associated domain